MGIIKSSDYTAMKHFQLHIYPQQLWITHWFQPDSECIEVKSPEKVSSTKEDTDHTVRKT